MSRLQRFPLLTRDEIENSPSRRDGVPASLEARTHKIAIKNIMRTAANFAMSIYTCATGVILYRRFYARRSLRHNTPYILAAASLFLASKINDQPRTHQEIAAEMLKVWYDRPPARARLQQDQEWTTRLFSTILDAEWVLLHALGFTFNVDVVHARVHALLRSPRHRHLVAVPGFEQHVLGTCNDILRMDCELLLEYPAAHVAAAVVYFGLKLYKNSGHPVTALADGTDRDAGGLPWFVEEGLSVENSVVLTSRFAEQLYRDAAKGPIKDGSGARDDQRPESAPEDGAAEPAAGEGGDDGPAPPPPQEPTAKTGGSTRESSPEEGELEEGELEP